jgi:CHAD domain-containing protein
MTALTQSEPLSLGLDRVFQAEVNATLAPNPVDDTPVHNVRVGTKKLRAYLRLLKPRLGNLAFDEANTLLRNASRSLRTYRAIEVVSETLAFLADRENSHLTTQEAEALALALRPEDALVGRDTALACLRNDIHAMRTRLNLGMLPVKWSDISLAIRRSYRRNRNAFHNVVRHPSNINLHEWRKQVKRLQYQIAILRPMWPKRIAKLDRRLDILATTLGRYLDLSTLKKHLDELETSPKSRAQTQALALIARVRRDLRSEAIATGNTLYDTSPSDFVAALAHHWSRWHREARTVPRRTTPPLVKAGSDPSLQLA